MRGLYVGHSTDGLVDAATRLLDLMADSEEAEMLGPLVVDEIVIRLLRTAVGPRVAQIGQPKSGVQRIGEAVCWIRAHFAQPVTVDEMAASVHMSASTFHERFKAVTSLSPLQYQKVLRLHEARRLMLFQRMDASDAGHRVGYLSPSQFSREYARFFGNAPTRDIARVREEGFAHAGSERLELRGTTGGSAHWRALAMAMAVGAAALSQSPALIVKIDSGELQGSLADGVASFKGIPFAAPPVGELRWRPPQPVAKWTGVRQATEFGADCMQGRFGPPPAAAPGAPTPPMPSEDCLYLNVWRPVIRRARNLPVMVWIYGGGFTGGSSASPNTSGVGSPSRASSLSP